MTEPVIRYVKHVAMAHTYGVLKPGPGKVNICLCNISANKVVVSKKIAKER